MKTMERFVEIERIQQMTVLRFANPDLNVESFEGIADELNSILFSHRPRQVIVDMGSIRHVDDYGWAMLQSLHDGVEELDGTTVFCSLSRTVMKSLAESGLEHLLEVRPSLNEAIWVF